jgi:hypothetical protein
MDLWRRGDGGRTGTDSAGPLTTQDILAGLPSEPSRPAGDRQA